MFTDESQYKIFVHQKFGGKKGTALQAKNLWSIVKDGGGIVLVWGNMSWSGIGSLVFIDGKMD